MKLQILSDLHLEFADFIPEPTDADVVILAGDTHTGAKGIAWAKQYFPDQVVLYVLGNHEYYGQAYPKLLGEMRTQAQHSKVQVLENDVFSYGGITFLGCTLWTDFALFGNSKLAGIHAMQHMTDYKKIRVSSTFSKLRSIDTAMIHQTSKRWLKQQFLEHQGQPLVVISHHAPGLQSVPENFQSDLLSAAYASSLEALVESSGAALWIHGHVHHAQDYQIGQTQVICNPRGYPDESTGFQADLLLDVSG